MNHPAQMFKYHAWANQTIMSRIIELPSSVLSQELNTSFPTIAYALSHIYAVDKMWYWVVTGRDMREALQLSFPLFTSTKSTIEEYVSVYAELSKEFMDWFQSRADLEQSIILDDPSNGIRKTRLSEIVFQIVNHGTYHRGNISTMLRQLGYASVKNDYSLFWYKEPGDMN